MLSRVIPRLNAFELTLLVLIIGCGEEPVTGPGTPAALGWKLQTATYSVEAVWGNSATSVFAVGIGGAILHYDGFSWSPMTTGNGGLNSIWGSSDSSMFAVGRRGKILHYDGTSWSTMTSGTNSSLLSIWGSSGHDVFAV
jgi:hypothetical protein